MEFSDDQRRAIDFALSGKSFFLTGKAGTGKSTVINELRRRLNGRIVFLATTGIAASNIMGETLHSFFAIKPFGVLEEPDANWVKKEKRIMWSYIKTIVIDEVSMLRPDVLECINWTLQKNLGRTLKSFQVIFVGDMKQLPPVYKSNDETRIREIYRGLSWQDANLFEDLKWEIPTIELNEVKRQTDLDFIANLNKVRDNEPTDYFDQFIGNPKGVVLCPYNAQVSEYNIKMINTLPGELITIPATLSDFYKPGSTIAEESLVLKNGCSVMYLKNDEYFYNGFLGTFTKEGNHLYVNGIRIEPHTWYTYLYDIVGGRLQPVEDQWIVQYPIKPSYALTIHKSQGLTLDQVTIDLSRDMFSPGQLYTALSRVKSPDGLSIIK